MTDTNSSGTRAIVDSSECGICEPCAPSKMPNIGQSSNGVMTFDQFLCLPCDVDEPAGSGMRAVDPIEGAVGEPCASKRSKKPKLGQSSKGASSSAAAEGDTADANQVEVKRKSDCREPSCTKRRTHGPDEENRDEGDGGVSADATADDAGGTALDTTDADTMPNGSRICAIASCSKETCWGPIDGARKSACFCSRHGKEHGGCENVKQKKCEAHPCKRRPAFGPAGGLPNTATCCAEHGKPKGYVNIVSPRCEHASCVIIATFGKPGGSRARCSEHSQPDDVGLASKMCEHADCDTHASFGKPGGTRTRCGEHREPDDVDLASKMCEHANCDKTASFGKPGGKRALCNEHSGLDDVDLHRNKLFYDCEA